MEEIKYTRFEYLSNYYRDLLQARLELNNDWLIRLAVWIQNMKNFKLWKVEWADKVAKPMIIEMLDKMIIEVEKELKSFIDKQINK